MAPRKALVIHDGILYWKCSKCGELKEPKNFCPRKDASNGLVSQCRECEQERVEAWQKNNPERFRETQRKYMATADGKASARKKEAKYALHNPEKKYAKMQVDIAKKRGDLIPQPCEVCASNKAIHAHHDDYKKPVDVRWLCQPHHVEHHNKIRAIQGVQT